MIRHPRRLLGAALVAATAFLLAQPLACSCNGNGHLPQTPFVARPGDNVVNCACNLTLAYHTCDNGICQAHFQIELCLPPELRLAPDADLGASSPDAGLGSPSPDAGLEPYAQRLDDYCRKDITNAAYHLIKVFNQSWCDYKRPLAPDGGVGESVVCFAHELNPGREDATRYAAGACPDRCPDVECDYDKNCGEGVQDTDGDIHLERCQCNQVRAYGCPGDPASDLPTAVFCRPTDPPAPQ